MKVVFTFPCITSCGQVRLGDMVDLPRDEADYLIERGMCHEHKVLVPHFFSGPVGTSIPTGPPFRDLPDANASKSEETAETRNPIVFEADIRKPQAGRGRRR